VTNTLRNQIIGEKTAHAYLFTGSRGTGKTTCARIFAKALCCTNSHDGNPCLQCENCKDAESARLSDIIEIDAASNNSVEDVRDLREGAVYLPERCKYKVYIIDEVHMLSASAFNALLKIMEEPPQFVKFILATTEIHKVPATILSRCQRFDFKRILPEDISKRLDYIAEREGFSLSPQASLLIAKLSDGGMRDAISILDQASAYSNEITEEVVSNAMGLAGREYLLNAIEYLCNRDSSRLFELVDSLYVQSKNLMVFCSDLLAQLRNVMVLKVAPKQIDNLACMPNELERLTGFANGLDLDTILFYMNRLESCYRRLGSAGDKRVELEVSLAGMCNQRTNVGSQPSSAISPQLESTVSNLNERINTLEKKLEDADYAPQPRTNHVRVSSPTNSNKQSNIPNELRRIDPKLITHVQQEWQTIIAEVGRVNPGIHSVLVGSNADIYMDTFLLIYPTNSMLRPLFDIPEYSSMIEDAILKVLGKKFKVFVKRKSDTVNSTQTNGLKQGIDELCNKAMDNNVPIINRHE
jgi:DNA polymerase-3 subunit gamma/tau